MFLFEVKRTDRIYYDEYDSAIIACNTVAEAKSLFPEISVDKETLLVSKIGVAVEEIEYGIVLGSFNAG